MSQEVRYYKGKYKVEVLQKSKGNWLVKALEKIPFHYFMWWEPQVIQPDTDFITHPRLLWRHPRK